MNKRRKKIWKTSNTEHRTSNVEGKPGDARRAGTGGETVVALSLAGGPGGETPPELAAGTAAIPIISAPGFGIVHHFTVDAVTIEGPGSSTRHTRREVEGWLAGMNAARRQMSEEDCRRAVSETIRVNRMRTDNDSGSLGAAGKKSGQTCQRHLPSSSALPGTIKAHAKACIPNGRAVVEMIEANRKPNEDGRWKIEDRGLQSDDGGGSFSAAAKKSGRKGSGSATCESALPGTIKAHAKACTPNAQAVLEMVAANTGASVKRGQAVPAPLSGVAAVIIGLICLIGRIDCRASEIIRGYAPQDGQQLYAADLDNLVDESVIGVQFYNDQQTTPVLGSGYYFLVLNPANQTYYRINAQQVLYGNTNFFQNAPPEGVPGYGYLLFYDPSNNWVASTTVSNFLWNSASNINVASLSFANTNNGGATNAFVLPLWPYPVFSALGPGTNYPVHFLIFDTNGIPYREGLSNLESHVASDMGMVFALPWEYRQEFAPWQLYGTNQTAPYTNAFGFTTNFPITALFQPNNGNTLTNSTLTDTDTVPVNSYQQGVVGLGAPTNTTATLLSIYEYLTNKNTLPPYTIARAQFAGTPDLMTITNMDPVTGIITNLAAVLNWSNAPAAISFAGAAAQIPTVPQVQSNTVYYAVQTNWQTPAFQIYTNLSSALARTAPITGNGVAPSAGHEGTLAWITNYTDVDLSVIALYAAATPEPGWYGCYFQNGPAATPFYYMTGSAETQTAGPQGIGVGFLNYGGYQMITTNGFWLLACVNGTPIQPPLVEVMVNPQ